MLRDTQERGRDLEQVLATYANFVKPAFEEFCLPVSLQKAQLTYYNSNQLQLNTVYI